MFKSMLPIGSKLKLSYNKAGLVTYNSEANPTQTSGVLESDKHLSVSLIDLGISIRMSPAT
jgi:hypothetical protein